MLSTAFLFGCSGESTKSYTNAEGKQVVDVMYSNGLIKSRTQYLDSKSEYLYTEYFEDGVLKDSMHVVNGQAEGQRIFFDRSGDLLHTENYLHGVLHGPHHAMYSNGVASFAGYRLNGAMVGEWVFHYPDGKPITYEFYDSTGHVKFLEKYGSAGEVLSVEGNALITIRPLARETPLNDSLYFDVVAARPPGASRKLIVEAHGNSDKQQLVYSSQIDSLHNTISLLIDKATTTNLDFDLQIKDKKSGAIKEYNIHEVINGTEKD